MFYCSQLGYNPEHINNISYLFSLSRPTVGNSQETPLKAPFLHLTLVVCFTILCCIVWHIPGKSRCLFYWFELKLWAYHWSHS